MATRQAELNRKQRRDAERQARKEFAQRKRGEQADTIRAAAANGEIPPELAAAAAAAGVGSPPPPPSGTPGTPGDVPDDIMERAQQAAEQIAAGVAGGGSAAPALRAAPRGRAATAADGEERKRLPRFITLEMSLAELLCSPGTVAMTAGDAYCQAHFMIQGPVFAAQLTAYAETNAAVYRYLKWMAEKGGLLVVVMATVSYVLPPMIHHGLPVPGTVAARYGLAPDGAAARPPAPAPVTAAA